MVGLKVYHGTKQLLPEKDELALDDATPTFGLDEPVNVGDPIRVDWINHDDTYSHSVSVIVGIIPKGIIKV